MLDTWSLRILVEVAERGSFSAAAEVLTLSQPAVSRQMSRLERQFGVALFQRAARGVVPTTAGNTAIELARDALARLDAIDATMKGIAGIDAGHLRLAAFPSANTFFIPEAIRRFGAAHPGVTTELSQVDPHDPRVAVATGRVDLALLTAWQLDGARIDRVELVPLMDERLAVALPDTHPLAQRRTVPLEALHDEVWIEGAHPDCLGPIPQLADAIGAPPRIGFVCDDWNGKQALVAAGAGIMLVPTLAQKAMRPGIHLRPTTPRLPSRRLYAAAPRPPFRTPAAEAMLELLTEIIKSGSATDTTRRHPDVSDQER
jgi:DNA-binding transcriptional LysR family regulator